jgi:hypothetical protein
MAKKNILIITGTGGNLGTGHLQRMLGLAVHLNKTDDFSVKIFLKQNQIPPEKSFENLFIDSIPDNTDLIISDMRDSFEDEMLFLKDNAPVLAVDDSGPGNLIADYKITLLPIPSDGNKPVKPDTDKFLYGYNFSKGMESLTGKTIAGREIDVAVYTGYDPLPELVADIKKSIPASVNAVLLSGKKPVSLTGNIPLSETGYAEILCRTKIIITHFGLTMFEAHAAGCGIAAFNPTIYHSSLTEIMKDEFQIIFSSEYNNFSPDQLRETIIYTLKNFTDKKVSLNYILDRINTGRENFTAYLKKIAE